MSENHAGKYTCRAENNGGSAESTADLVVKKKHLSPVFLRRLQSQVIALCQKLVLEVEIGGFRLPQVIWYSNEKQVNFQFIKTDKRTRITVSAFRSQYEGKPLSFI